MNKKLFITLAIILVAAVILAFRPPAFARQFMESTDLVAIFGKRSFDRMLTLLPDNATRSAENDWTFSAPDDSAEFHWSAQPGTQGQYDAFIRTPIAPFLAAGLKPERLPDGMVRGESLVFVLAKAANAPKPDADTPEASFASILDAHRDSVSYHFQLGHYGIDLGGGNLLEWAAVPEENTLDLVFALEPEVFERAGVDKHKVAGWIAGSVIVHDANGRKVDTPKLLKPFDLLKNP